MTLARTLYGFSWFGQWLPVLRPQAASLADHPEKVEVHSVEGHFATVLELRVDPEDVGHVIGASRKPFARFSVRLVRSGISALQWKFASNQFEELVMSAQVKAKPVSIQDFVAGLRKLPELAFNRTDQVIDFLRLTPVAPDTLAPYLIWDRQHYTRNLIDKTPLYELIAICWKVGQTSSVHNHQDQNCWMAVPIGRLLVQNYRIISQDLKSGKCKLEATNKVEMNPGHPCRVDPREPVHRVFNPREFNERAVSLHVYSRPIDSCVVYSPEQGTCGEIKLHYTTQYGKPSSSR